MINATLRAAGGVQAVKEHFTFPYKGWGGHTNIITDTDGLPNVNMDTWVNDPVDCPAAPGKDIFGECVAGVHGSKKGGCGCGPPGHKHMHDCHMCHIEAFIDHKNRPDALHCPQQSRRQLIERGLGWVLMGAHYHNGWSLETCSSDDHSECPKYGYQAVCNGYTDMAWQGGGDGCQERIECVDLQPGDKIKSGNHQVMFRKWLRDDDAMTNKRDAIIYQMGGQWGKGNVGIYHVQTKKGHCFRRKHLTDSPGPSPSPHPHPSPSPSPHPSPSPTPTPTPPSPTPPSPPAPPSTCPADLQEKVCYGGETEKQEAKSVEECCSACAAKEGCTHFTLSGSTCGLKKGTPGSSSHHKHCTSGVMPSAADFAVV
jgi:hypothetical protein